MKNLSTNQLVAALLIALLLERMTALLSSSLIHPSILTKPAYIVEGVTVSPKSTPSIDTQELALLSPLMAGADPQKGQKSAKKCLQCHTFDRRGPHKIGPRLHGVYGQKIGSQEGFPYSKAMKEKGGTWDEETLNALLYKPRTFVPNTKMSFAGIQSAQERADLVAYLKTLQD